MLWLGRWMKVEEKTVKRHAERDIKKTEGKEKEIT